VQAAERELLAGKRDVDDLLAQAAVELLVGERALARVDRGLEPLPDAVEQHPALAVAHAAERLDDRGFAAEVTDADLLELGRRARGRNRGAGVRLVLFPIGVAARVAQAVDPP